MMLQTILLGSASLLTLGLGRANEWNRPSGVVE